ncbi:MAG: ATP-binding protein, partial [Chloroflexota bacterium]
MNRYYDDTIINLGVSLKLDLMAKWIDSDWLPKRSEPDLMTLWVMDSVVHDAVMGKFDLAFELPDGWRFTGVTPVDCPVVARVIEHVLTGELAYRSGAFLYRFAQGETVTEALVMASRYTDDGRMISLANLPKSFLGIWTAFSVECDRLLRALSPEPKVMIIGGRTASFVPTTRWEEVVLPETLKDDILHDVETFFTKGIEVYKKLNLKPFRKMLLAGVPGTGKTMLCSALAQWALDRGYLVIYISSADQMGATFGKIQQALHVASYSQYPTLILLEELDAFLHDREKALV